MNNKNIIYPKTFVLELAAIVFLIITVPVWLPLALSLLAGGFGLIVIILIVGLIISGVAKSNDLVTEFYIVVSNNEIIYL